MGSPNDDADAELARHTVHGGVRGGQSRVGGNQGCVISARTDSAQRLRVWLRSMFFSWAYFCLTPRFRSDEPASGHWLAEAGLLVSLEPGTAGALTWLRLVELLELVFGGAPGGFAGAGVSFSGWLLAAGKNHCRQSNRGQGWDFVFHGLLMVAVNRRAVIGRGARSTGRF